MGVVVSAFRFNRSQHKLLATCLRSSLPSGSTARPSNLTAICNRISTSGGVSCRQSTRVARRVAAEYRSDSLYFIDNRCCMSTFRQGRVFRQYTQCWKPPLPPAKAWGWF